MRKRLLGLAVVATMLIGTTALPAQAGTIYHLTKGWTVKNAKGQVMMSPWFAIRWSAGKNVTGVLDFVCGDGPGYTSYKGCETSHGKPGYPSMGIGVTWHYVLGFDPIGLVIKYYCDFRGSIWENGGITGTIVCDYGSG